MDYAKIPSHASYNCSGSQKSTQDLEARYSDDSPTSSAMTTEVRDVAFISSMFFFRQIWGSDCI